MEGLSDPSELVQLLIRAALDGHWPKVVALGLVIAVFLLRKILAPKIPFFGTGPGGAVLNLLTSFSVALATPLLGGVVFTWSLLWVALQASLTAAGGWSLARYLWPLLPEAFRKLFSRGDSTEAIAESKKEGIAAAVVAKSPRPEDIVNGP